MILAHRHNKLLSTPDSDTSEILNRIREPTSGVEAFAHDGMARAGIRLSFRQNVLNVHPKTTAGLRSA
jgi:hypothetical protein